MIEAPCKDCKDRKIPKTCEKTCDKWNKYRAELDVARDKIQKERLLIQDLKAGKRRRDRFYGTR